MALAIAAATFVTTSCEEEGPIVNKHPQPDPEEQEPGEQDPDAVFPEGTYYPEEIPTLDEYVGLPTPLAEELVGQHIHPMWESPQGSMRPRERLPLGPVHPVLVGREWAEDAY